MTDFNPLEFIAGHAGMCFADAIREAYEQGKRDALPEIIRCKDCEYWETDWSCGGAMHYCPMADDIHGPNFYCGYAEEGRTDETD